MVYITEDGLKALDSYSYKSGAYSLLDNLLNPFWTGIANILPKWLAPNVVTLTGTMFLLSMVVVILIEDPTLEGKASSWAYFYFAFCVWVYQTLDAVDGKQARRTGSSSALGQLFDHGCDSLGTTPLALAICSCLGLGATIRSLLILATIQVPFWLAQFGEHNAHALRTQVANFGVTEGQYLEASAMVASGIFGSGIWRYNVAKVMGDLVGTNSINFHGSEHIEFRDVIVFMGSIFPALMALTSCYEVARVAHPSVFLKAIPLVLLETGIYFVTLKSPASELFRSNPVPFIAIFGLLFTQLSNVIIIASVCKMDYPMIHKVIMFPLPILLLTIYSTKDTNVHKAALAAYAVVVVGQVLHYAFSVVDQISRYLNISVLTIGQRFPAGATSGLEQKKKTT